MAKGLYKKFRGVTDAELSVVLENHAGMLNGMGRALTMMLRERRLLLLWNIAVTAAVILLLLR